MHSTPKENGTSDIHEVVAFDPEPQTFARFTVRRSRSMAFWLFHYCFYLAFYALKSSPKHDTMTTASWGLPKPPRPSNDETNRTNYLTIVDTIRWSTDDDNSYVQKLVRPFHPYTWIDVPGNRSTIRPNASIAGHLFCKFETTTASTHMRPVLAVPKVQNVF